MNEMKNNYNKNLDPEENNDFCTQRACHSSNN